MADLVVRESRVAVEIGGGDDPRVGEGGEHKDDEAASHDCVGKRPVPPGEAWVGDERKRGGEEEEEASAHERQVEELKQRVGPPAAHLLRPCAPALAAFARPRTALAKAAAKEARAERAPDERLAQMADESGRRAAEGAHVEEESERRAADADDGP